MEESKMLTTTGIGDFVQELDITFLMMVGMLSLIGHGSAQMKQRIEKPNST